VAELVEHAGVAADELVLEIGAGTGRLTEALARSARRVVAIELDPEFVAGLRRRFRARADVDVVEADFLLLPLPGVPFRAFGNVPFALTTAILRRLLDAPTSSLLRADLIVQYETARKRATMWPSSFAGLGWQPWWEFRLVRRLPASAFEPVPSVDAGVLSIVRHSRPLLSAEQRGDYIELLRAGFRRADLPVPRSLRGRIPERAWKRMARERGIAPDARAIDLDVFDWVALFSLARGSSPP